MKSKWLLALAAILVVACQKPAAQAPPAASFGDKPVVPVAAENLAIGKEAPDIEGVDLDSVAFKLSDYRGKVVVLDFWGDW